MGVQDGGSGRFEKAIANNLLFKLMERRRPFRGRGVFSTGLKQLIDSTTLDELDQHFPISGLEHVHAGLQAKRGVILVSFHGSAENRVALQALRRRLEGVKRQVIAHNMAVEESEFSGYREFMPSAVAGSMYAELAFFGQKLLQQGGMLHIFGGDTFAEGPGRTHWIEVGDRRYEIKPGFAELALNTGAVIIPTFGRFLEDGRVLLEFLPPFEIGRGTRDQQIAALVSQYADFVNMFLKTYPESLFWKRLRVHLNRPRKRAG
jgi:lauroyl/myristoyl acyltransferase